jgi:DNA modification methylase
LLTVSLVLDPFAGAARIGRALRQVGGRRYLGVEIDAANARAALGELLGEPEGTYRPTTR